MPGLLEFLGLNLTVKPPAAVEMVDMSTSPADKATLARARKTLAYARQNSPDEAVRILNRVLLDLKDLATRSRGEVTEVLGEAESAVEDYVAEARKTVSNHCAHWIEEWTALAGPAPTEPAEKHKRAEKLLHFINHTGEGIVRDRDMVSRLSAYSKDPDLLSLTPVLAEQEKNVKLARAAWEELVPQRTTEGPPTKAPKVSRPQPKGVKDPELWSAACDRVDLAAAQGKAPAPEDVALMAKGAQDALTADTDWNWEVDLKTRFKCNWDTVKAKFKDLKKTDPTKATPFMSGYWWFRKLTVDTEMKALAALYKFEWESVGSTNLESDYDISVRTHGVEAKKTVWDWQIVAMFNKKLSARFNGVQPGTLFDTNLYASAEPAPLKDPKEKSATENDMDAMAEAGQDIGALMKMRRYMGWDDYVDYQDSVLAEIGKTVSAERNEDKKKLLQKRLVAARRQFETADALYFQKLTQTLDNAGVKYDKGIADTPAGQKKLIGLVEELEKNPDKLMAATNAAYVAAMEEVRKIELELQALDEALEALKGKVDQPSVAKRTETQDKRAAAMARLETLQADAVFFAAEAYHSKGPFQHIVQAGQKSAQEVKADSRISEADQGAAIGAKITERLKLLPITSFMQSFNEQLGDFLKDLKHYDEKSPFPGLGLYRSSKYLERLCEAMDWIGKKLDGDRSLAAAATDYKKITINGQAPAVVKGKLGGLVDLRGGKVEFKDVADPQQEMEAWALAETQKIFGGGVKTLSDLGTLVKGLGKQVNIVLRKADVAQKMMAESEKAYFPKKA